MLVAKLNSGNILGETMHDFLHTGWVGLLMYAAIWTWYSW